MATLHGQQLEVPRTLKSFVIQFLAFQYKLTINSIIISANKTTCS